jgi:2-isopropylmalate synthase
VRDPAGKYCAYPRVSLSERRWPERALERAPRWCSVDLRDGNQALIEPMGPERKHQLFDALVALGFREIEVAHPSSSALERAFLRELIEGERVPESVELQVLTPARADWIETTMAALRGARRAIVHLYNSTSEVQRRVVFGLQRAAVIELAVRAAERIRELAERMPQTAIRYQYSPESFTGTELEFALEICEAVLDVWEPTPARPVILNFAATVEMSSPNVFADRIEWLDRALSRRAAVVLCVHPHNDRGCAVAAAELALLAGAQRVEGTLFGNGERTGNVDLVTLALNLYTHGIDPQLRLGDLDALVRVAERCNRLPVHPRHPYAGALVYSSFSGTHQDAIRKGLAERARSGELRWQIPYLPLDPADVGRSYREVIRINSQSGKGGIAYALERDRGLRLPRAFQIELRDVLKALAERSEAELGSEQLWSAFEHTHLAEREALVLLGHRPAPAALAPGALLFRVRCAGAEREIAGRGAEPLAAFAAALRGAYGIEARIAAYDAHQLVDWTGAQTAAYLSVEVTGCGAGNGAAIAADELGAALRAFAIAVARAWGEPVPAQQPALAVLPS